MTDLIPITALGSQSAQQVSFGALTISEEPELGIASFTLRAGHDAPIVCGMTLPEVGKLTQKGGDFAFWSAPNQWMIIGAGQGTGDFAAKIKAKAPDATVSDQTDGFASFSIRGDQEKLEQMMTKLVNLPPDAYAVGCATRTGMEHMTVFLVREDESSLLVLGPRSFAGSIWHALGTAARRLT
ncbi:sarcosine oxidase subunit gamma [Donghicola sp. XS_ASV15]|uniref:sarcosine oxidase subunit gamma n=1 Tax=Donghicola sp. XS_ASV15 TaxID=3241295 RepID=UPI003514C174